MSSLPPPPPAPDAGAGSPATLGSRRVPWSVVAGLGLVAAIVGLAMGALIVAADETEPTGPAVPVPATTTSLPTPPTAPPLDVEAVMEGRTASDDLIALEFEASPFGPVGTCMATGTTMRVSCSSEHDSEVFGIIPIEASAYPGALTLTAAVDEACGQHFARLRDRDGIPEGYFPINWQPSEASWGEGRRDAVCTLQYVGGQTRGSVLAGSAEP